MRFLSRAQWGAAPAKDRVRSIGIKVDRVFLHHTVTGQYLDDPAKGARDIQSIAFGRGFDDVSYSFLVFADGTVAEGRGWGKVGAHTQGYNSTSYGVAFVGNYHDTDTVTDAMVDAFRQVVDDGVANGYLVPRGSVRFDPHRAVKATACPGDRVVARFDEFTAAPDPQQEDDDMPPKPVQRGKTDDPADGGEGGLWMATQTHKVPFGNQTELKAAVAAGLVSGTAAVVLPRSLFQRLVYDLPVAKKADAMLTALAGLSADSGGGLSDGDVDAIREAVREELVASGEPSVSAAEVADELAARLSS